MYTQMYIGGGRRTCISHTHSLSTYYPHQFPDLGEGGAGALVGDSGASAQREILAPELKGLGNATGFKPVGLATLDSVASPGLALDTT